MADSVDSLPPEISLQYLAEGAANIVYRILSPTDWVQKGYLLRLHKEVPWIPSYRKLHEHFTQNVAPLFLKDDLVAQELVHLPPQLIYQLNQDLVQAESPLPSDRNLPLGSAAEQSPPRHGPLFRPEKRHGLYLDPAERYGMLVTDMSSKSTPHSTSSLVDVAIEIKPKWLAQSPNAPPGSRRCRTCALHAYRLSKEKPTHRPAKSSKPYFCPLELVSGSQARVLHIAQDLLRDSIEPLSDDRRGQVTEALTAYLVSTGILARLQDAQLKLDPRGIMRWSVDEELNLEFLIATTLRDCTLFLRVKEDPGVAGGILSIEARLGDLDLKMPEPGKRAHWRRTEEILIEEGWYAGRAGAENGQGVICHIERELERIN